MPRLALSQACPKPKRAVLWLSETVWGIGVVGERVQVESKAQGDRELEDLGGKGTVRRADLALSTEWKAPRTEAERRLATIWRDVFCMDKIGSLDDFFELGGDSFMATALAAEI